MAFNYVIYAPDHVGNSAGIRCLYILADLLHRKGHKAYVTGNTHRPPKEYKLRHVSVRGARDIVRWSHSIAVYPETISGNPLGAMRVARWVMNKPGFLGGATRYPDSELVFIYSDVYAQHVQNKIHGKLYIPTIDEEIFFPSGSDYSSRSLECFYEGKSRWRDGYVNEEKAFEITRDSPKRSELGKLFRASKALYCFDNSTILIYEAIACGCPVVIIPDGTHSREDYERLELGTAGIAWGPQELGKAIETVGNFRARYEGIKTDYLAQVDEFIRITQAPPLMPESSCASCSALKYELEAAQAEIDLLQSDLADYRSSIYLKVRKRIHKLPIIDKLLALLGYLISGRRPPPRRLHTNHL